MEGSPIREKATEQDLQRLRLLVNIILSKNKRTCPKKRGFLPQKWTFCPRNCPKAKISFSVFAILSKISWGNRAFFLKIYIQSIRKPKHIYIYNNLGKTCPFALNQSKLTLPTELSCNICSVVGQIGQICPKILKFFFTLQYKNIFYFIFLYFIIFSLTVLKKT